MSDSAMVIMWPSRDAADADGSYSSVTLSQRKAPYETMPTPDLDPPFVATLDLAETSVRPPPSSLSKSKAHDAQCSAFLNRGCSLGLRGDSDGIHPACESMLRLYPFVFSGGAQLVFHGFFHLALQAPPDGMQDIIWAFSRTPPESADADADISIHHLYGISALNLARTAADVSEDEPVPSPVPSADAGGRRSRRGCG